MNVGDTLKKIRTNVKKEEDKPQNLTDIVSSATEGSGKRERKDVKRAEKAFEDGEGCTLKGFISVNRVPGNFHIGSHAYNEILMLLGKRTNLTHTINHLSFGRKRHITSIESKFQANTDGIAPLDGHSHKSERLGTSTNYHLSLVPTNYKDSLGIKYPVYQFTYGVGSKFNDHEVIFFNFDITGFTLNYQHTAGTLSQFLLRV